ncbi:hypothetical protein BFP71_11590 [Roseivirga misakiensis]|uniref:Uncharacterized protein n=2 Tax=Roseivirga misakiensis TaxID=1563681 RepID=A0A1E5SYD2_9BACT|nr:hypothetical protein BFP71_11590 [Roseivirga misakiensis]
MISIGLQAQVESEAKPLTKKELRAKRKKAKEIEKLNRLSEIRRKAKELLINKDFVIKDDGRSGVSGTASFFKIHGDTVTIQTWSNGQTGTSLDYRRGARKVVGDIFNYEIIDNGPEKPLQVFINFIERLTFSQQTATVYVFGKRVEAAGIRGYFSSVADANIWETGILSSNRGTRIQRARSLGGN